MNSFLKPDPRNHQETTPWDLRITHDDFLNLKTDQVPASMDDRWVKKHDVVKSSDPETIDVYVARRWTGFTQFILNVVDHGGERGAVVESLTWEARAAEDDTARLEKAEAMDEACALVDGLCGSQVGAARARRW